MQSESAFEENHAQLFDRRHEGCHAGRLVHQLRQQSRFGSTQFANTDVVRSIAWESRQGIQRQPMGFQLLTHLLSPPSDLLLRLK